MLGILRESVEISHLHCLWSLSLDVRLAEQAHLTVEMICYSRQMAFLPEGRENSISFN